MRLIGHETTVGSPAMSALRYRGTLKHHLKETLLSTAKPFHTKIAEGCVKVVLPSMEQGVPTLRHSFKNLGMTCGSYRVGKEYSAGTGPQACCYILSLTAQYAGMSRATLLRLLVCVQ